MALFVKQQRDRLCTIFGLVMAITMPYMTAHAKEPVGVTSGWKTECIGRYQISIPGDVEIAVRSLDYFLNGAVPGIGFANGSPAEWRSGFSYSGGALGVSAIVPSSEFKKYKTLLSKSENVSIQIPSASKSNEIKLEWPKTPGSMYAKGAEVAFFRDSRIYNYEIHNDIEVARKERDYFLANFSTRSLYEIPSVQGVCFPYGFVKDDGSRERRIGVTMRLLDHPDVEILFSDSSASDESNYRKEVTGSRGNVEYFWGKYSPSLGNELEGSVFNHYHNVKLGEFTGVYAIATIARPEPHRRAQTVSDAIRPSETPSEYTARMKKEIAEKKHPLDYGYVAYFKGDPNAKVDTPDLMLYVIRTASRATAVGKQPVSKEDLKRMAEVIAASIKRRP